MRKKDLGKVIDEFSDSAGELRAYYTVVWTKFAGQPLELTVLGITAEHALLSLAVSWEVFVNDFFVAAINRRSSRYKEWLRDRMRESIETKFGRRASRFTQIGLPRHPSVKDVLALAAKDERNIPLKDANSMVSRAVEWLSPDYSTGFRRLGPDDKDFVDALIKMRHYLAHSSVSASEEMDRALRRLERTQSYRDLGRRGRRVRNLGAFLRTWAPVDGLPRIITYCDVAQEIAEKLRPVGI